MKVGFVTLALRTMHLRSTDASDMHKKIWKVVGCYNIPVSHHHHLYNSVYLLTWKKPKNPSPHIVFACSFPAEHIFGSLEKIIAPDVKSLTSLFNLTFLTLGLSSTPLFSELSDHGNSESALSRYLSLKSTVTGLSLIASTYSCSKEFLNQVFAWSTFWRRQ